LPRKRLLILVVALIGTAIVIGAGLVIALVTIDWRPWIEAAAGRALDRRLSIGTLRIVWGNPLVVHATDLHLANAGWSSAPDMVGIGEISAEIDLGPLLHGVVRYERLSLKNPALLLERDAAGSANWRFPAKGSWWPGHLAVIPKDRSQFPTLIDLALQGGTLIYRAAGHRDLRLELHNLTIRSPGDDQTVTLAMEGAYNGLPLQLRSETAAFSVMRDRAVPYGFDLSIATTAGTLAAKGTMTEPLDFEGVEGPAQLDAPKIGELLTLVGADLPSDVPLHLAGNFAKHGERWQLSEASGTLAKAQFGGSLGLTEAARGQPDAIDLDLAFAGLDLKTLLADNPKTVETTHAHDAVSLPLDENPGTTIDARIAAKRLLYGTVQVDDFAIHASSAPGAISVDQLSFAAASGRVEASGSAHADKAGNRILAEFRLSGIDAAEIARLAGAATGQIAGKLDGGASFDTTGQTLADMLKRSRGQAVLAMSDGRVARALVEKASTDLRALFRTGEGWVPATCLLGSIDLRDGIASIAELRLRTPDATLIGTGTADLAASRLDLTLKAERARSSVFALDVPLRIAGDFTALSVRPAIGSPAASPHQASPHEASPPHRLPPELQALVNGSACRND
jgi:uncharacterized protein involved in outer membrane biogenesis